MTWRIRLLRDGVMGAPSRCTLRSSRWGRFLSEVSVLRSVWVGCLLGMLGLGPGLVHAQQPPGDRHLVVRSVPVYAGTDTRSAIVDDLPAHRLVYARPAGQAAWLEVFAVSEERHPIDRIGSIATPVHAENGRFIANDEFPEQHRIRPVRGFVKRHSLAVLRPQPIPQTILGSRVVVPQILERYGVKDRRFMPADPDRYPYAAVVTILGVDPEDNEKSGACSAFLVAPGHVASAGHCFRGGRDRYRWSVLRRHGTRLGYREIPAKLVFWSNEEASHGPITDSALLEVDPAEFAGIQPLALASPGPWLQAPSLQVLVLGFGGDLVGMKFRRSRDMGLPATTGLTMVHGDLCNLPAGQVELLEADRALRVVWPASDCISISGDSGGPILIWNDAKARLEVLGIKAQGEFIWLTGRRASRHWTDEAQALVATAAAETAEVYGFPMKDKQGVAVPHAYGALMRHARLTSPWRAEWAGIWNIDPRLYADVAKANRQADGFAALWHALTGGDGIELPLMVRQKDQATRVLSGPFEAELRAAWWRHAQKQPVVAAPATQWNVTYGSAVELAQLTRPGGPARAWRLGRFLELGEHLVPDDDTFDAYLAAMQGQVDARLRERPELQSSLSRYVELTSQYRILVVDNDWFVVDARTQRVVEVKRGWSLLARQEAQANGAGSDGRR